MTRAPSPWLDDDMPHDPERSAQQIAGLLDLLRSPSLPTPRPKRVLELGCGGGRILLPLVEHGHTVCGIDHDEPALSRCRRALHQLGARAELHEQDFREPWPVTGPFDAVLCLGNTFMTINCVLDAVSILKQACTVLSEDGCVILDDFPHDLWPELTDGNWRTGVSEDGDMQMLWTPGDATFALRQGDQVDETAEFPREGETLFRLWTMGELTLAAHLAGLSGPARVAEAGLLIMQPV